MANGNGNGDRLTWRTLGMIISIAAPIAGLGVAGFVLREQVKRMEVIEAKVATIDRQEWGLERDLKELHEDFDRHVLEERAADRKREMR